MIPSFPYSFESGSVATIEPILVPGLADSGTVSVNTSLVNRGLLSFCKNYNSHMYSVMHKFIGLVLLCPNFGLGLHNFPISTAYTNNFVFCTAIEFHYTSSFTDTEMVQVETSSGSSIF